MAHADGFVLPKPGIPKTFGILNILFGVLGMLCGLSIVGYTLATPMFLEVAEKAAKEAQAKEQARHKAELKEFDDKLAASKSDEEKKTIEKEKATYITNNPPDPEVDISSMTASVRNPIIIGHTCVFSGLGVIINILSIVAGIGLLKLSSWGRSLAVWLAAITIVVVGLSTATDIIVVQPIKVELTNKMFEKMQTDIAKTPGTPPNAVPNMKGASQMMAAFGMASAIGVFVVLSIYPIVSLIMLNTAGARAACLTKSV